jgi:hypothetical protein
MQIPRCASGPDGNFGSKSYGSQPTGALAVWGSDPLCGESGDNSESGDWSSQINGQAVGVGRAARGAITGVLLGASLWGAILVLAGFIKV